MLQNITNTLIFNNYILLSYNHITIIYLLTFIHVVPGTRTRPPHCRQPQQLTSTDVQTQSLRSQHRPAAVVRWDEFSDEIQRFVQQQNSAVAIWNENISSTFDGEMTRCVKLSCGRPGLCTVAARDASEIWQCRHGEVVLILRRVRRWTDRRTGWHGAEEFIELMFRLLWTPSVYVRRDI